jgi:thiosulfate/3-mercaptopyruvate sulfurtransferase
MSLLQRLRRGTRLSLLGGLVTAVAVVGVACGSDDNDAPADAAAPAAPATSGAASAPAADPAAATLDDRGYAPGYRLVSAAWLADHLEDPNVVVIDLRSAEDYEAGHIPGAVNLNANTAFNREDESGVPGQIGLPEQVAASLGSAGVTPDTTVVFYDGTNSLWAARALWVLDVYGHANVRILDGAWGTWEADGHPVSTEAPTVTATDYVFTATPNLEIIAGLDELVAAIDDPEALVCDVRSAEEYSGRDVRAAQGGHVPGAVNEDWRQAVNDRGEFHPASDLQGIYENSVLVGDTNKTVYVYCQTGVRAAHTWFVLHDLLGLERVKNYDGSWVEYGNRDDVEIARGS